VLTRDACSKRPITIKSHDLHASNIREVVDEITSSTREINSLPSFPSLSFVGCVFFDFSWPSLLSSL
jgi:hypothetical protein